MVEHNFQSHSHLPTLRNPDIRCGPPLLAHTHILHLPYNRQALLADHLPKHDMLPVQMPRLATRDEELAPVSIRSAVRHR